MHVRTILVILISTVLLAMAGSVRANPSDQEPTAPLALHDVSNAQELLKRYRALYDKTVQDLQRLMARGDRIQARALHDLHVDLRRLRRGALDLQMHGETAGVDYALRVDALRRQAHQAHTMFRANPTSGRQVDEVRQSLQNRFNQNVQRALARIDQQEQQQRWDNAYEGLQEFFDSVHAHAVFLSTREADPYLAPYLERNRRVSSRRNQQLREQVYQALETQIAESQPDLSGLLDAVSAAREQVASQGAAEIEERSRSGPECLEYFLDRWPDVHLQVLRGRAMVWAHQPQVSGTFLSETPAPPAHVDQAEYEAFCQQFLEELAGIVRADAQQVDSEQAQTRYAEYLEVLAPRVSRVAGGRLESAFEPALNELIDCSPALAEQVAAYEVATGELLRWRARVAAEAADSRTDDFPASGSLLTEAFTSSDEYEGLLPAQEPELSQAALRAGAPQVLEPASERLIGRGLRLESIAGLPGGRLAVSHYRQRHYATLPRPDVTAPVETLKRDLLVTETTPPLTLAAHTALASAEQGDFQSVGGTLQSVFLEGVIPRFAALPAGALPMSPLGPLPAETPDANRMLPQVMLRLQVQPTWAAHRYFFIELVEEP